jgi:hypothetical protein
VHLTVIVPGTMGMLAVSRLAPASARIRP